MQLITGVGIVIGCSAVGFVVAFLLMRRKPKQRKLVPAHTDNNSSFQNVGLSNFQDIAQDAVDKLNNAYEIALNALKDMNPQFTPIDTDEDLKLREEIKERSIESANIPQDKLLTKEQMEEKLKKRSRRVVCHKCGHKWLPLNKQLPKHCPKCHSMAWRKKN